MSQVQVESKKNALLAAASAERVAQSRLSEMSARQSLEHVQAKSQLESSGQELNKLRLQFEAAEKEIAITEEKLRLQLQAARLAAEAAARIRFENIDKDNFLLVVAPVSGVVTDIVSTQPGDKILILYSRADKKETTTAELLEWTLPPVLKQPKF